MVIYLQFMCLFTTYFASAVPLCPSCFKRNEFPEHNIRSYNYYFKTETEPERTSLPLLILELISFIFHCLNINYLTFSTVMYFKLLIRINYSTV